MGKENDNETKYNRLEWQYKWCQKSVIVIGNYDWYFDTNRPTPVIMLVKWLYVLSACLACTFQLDNFFFSHTKLCMLNAFIIRK